MWIVCLHTSTDACHAGAQASIRPPLGGSGLLRNIWLPILQPVGAFMVVSLLLGVIPVVLELLHGPLRLHLLLSHNHGCPCTHVGIHASLSLSLACSRARALSLFKEGPEQWRSSLWCHASQQRVAALPPPPHTNASTPVFCRAQTSARWQPLRRLTGRLRHHSRW